jgi:hypothetical protein
MNELLFLKTRSCVCCGVTVKEKARRGSGPNIIAISFLVYRRGASGKGQTKSAPAVQICETCLPLALTPAAHGLGTHADKLMRAVQQSLSARYSDMCENDVQADQRVIADRRASARQTHLLGGDGE